MHASRDGRALFGKERGGSRPQFLRAAKPAARHRRYKQNGPAQLSLSIKCLNLQSYHGPAYIVIRTRKLPFGRPVLVLTEQRLLRAVGDIITHDSDISGNGANIATRLKYMPSPIAEAYAFLAKCSGLPRR